MAHIEYVGQIENPQAIVIRAEAGVEGIEFLTPLTFGQQIGLMKRPKGHVVPLHRHNSISRTITETQEVLLLRRGTCEIDLQGANGLEVTVQLSIGDVILLASGAHRIRMTSECEILEIKQGPYSQELDKTILE
jgi:hypothetical protein